jgi:hypothetical protein
MVNLGLDQLLGWRPPRRSSRPDNLGFSSTIILILFHLAATTYSIKTHVIHWNASNPMFRIDRTDNVIDINGENHPWEYDQVNVVCPVYKQSISENQHEKYIIYSVTKQEYDSCRITQSNPKIIAVCNRPHEHMYVTITFRSFTPTPGGLEFRPGQSYYFISTSSKTDLHRRVGGSCSSHNMKVSFKIAPMPSINSDNTENNSIDSKNDRSLIYEHIPPASLHPFPGHRSIASSSGKGNLNSEYYYPMSEIRQASEQDIQNLSELQRADSSIFRRDSHQNDRGLNNARPKQSGTKASPSIMHSTASIVGVKISFISSIVLLTFLCR